MLQYILTALAGIAIGVVAMRIWQSFSAAEPGLAVADEGAPESAADEVLPAKSSPAFTQLLAKFTANHALILAGVVLLAAIAIFYSRGESGSNAASIASLPPGVSTASDQQLDDVDTMITRLAARLEANPDDGEGFRMLGWSYLMTGKPEEALAPFERAIELLPDDARVHAGYGEVLATMANNTVTPQAKSAFEKALMIDASDPRSRYFMALWKAQNGQGEKALDEWIALAATGPADAPWQVDIRREVERVSADLGVDVSDRLPPAPGVASAPASGGEPPVLDSATIQAANMLPASQRQTMIVDMVDRLASRLRANPADADGWVQLLRSRMVLEQDELAEQDLASARAALADDAAGLARLNAAAAEFGVPQR